MVIDMEKELVSRIILEYQIRLKNGSDKESARAFTYELFMSKYKYSKRTLDILTEKLDKKGFITKWIIDGFEFNGD